MKHRLETVLFLASFAILMVEVATSESNKTRLNSKVKPRIPLCCYNNTYFVVGKFDCEESARNATRQEKRMPKIYGTDLVSRNIGMSNEYFFFVVQRPPCVEGQSPLLPNIYEEDKWYFLSNGSMSRPLADPPYHLLDYRQYCLTRLMNKDKDKVYPKYFVYYCTRKDEETDVRSELVYSIGMLISVPFLIATYVVYWLLPELRNVHGQTLLKYIGCLIATYSTSGVIGVQLIPVREIYYSFCIIIALVVTFTFTASFFWLNVMCFDIWRTLREFRSLHVSVKQGEQKRFVIYSIYAWGSALFLTSVSAIMDFFPGVPEDLIRPQFCTGNNFWFHSDLAELLYFWGPISILIISNICLFISTARKIIRHKKSTTHHLKSLESKRHVDEEQRFSVYLKLFIVMGMSWSLEIIAWILDCTFAYVPMYFWYLVDLTNILHGFVIFILFVYTKKTKNLLIKRFSRRFCPRGNLTNSDRLSSVSRTTSGVIPLQDINLHS